MIPMTKIGEDMINLIIDILEDKEFDEASYNNLDSDEKTLFKNIIKKCDLGHYIDLNNLKNDEIDRLKNDFEVQMGLIGAGNDNPLIKKKLKEIISQMIGRGIMTKTQASDILLNL
jgi:hypothetical protein